MSLTENQTQVLRDSSRNAAIALLEDLAHMREIVRRAEPNQGELRRTSATLRRLLIDRDIAYVAAPRIGRLRFLAPDNSKYYELDSNGSYAFFGSGGAKLFGLTLRGIAHFKSALSMPDIRKMAARGGPDDTVDLSLDEFLSQRVLCFQGTWISRRRAIKHIANKASGVHTDTADGDDVEVAIAALRRSGAYIRGKGLLMDTHRVRPPDQPVVRYSPDAIDPVLWELLCAMHYVLRSPDTAKLEASITAEIAGRS